MSDPIADAIAARRAQLTQQTGGLPAASIDAAIAKRKSELNQMDGRTVVREANGGFVYQDQGGNLGFTSPGYSTNDRAKIVEILRGATPAELMQSDIDRERIAQHPVAARGNEVVRGVPFLGSYVDEAVGAVSPTARDNMRLSTESMQREHPGQTVGLNLTGGVLGSIPMGIAAAPRVAAMAPTTTVGRVAAGAGAGGAGGAVEGAVWGYGEGTGSERRENAGQQGAVGALMGTVLGGGLPIAGDLFEAAARRYKGEDTALIAREFGISTDAAKMLRRAFESNDAEAGKRILMAGPDATLADAGRSGQALLDAAAQTGGKPLSIVTRATEGRAAGALDVVNSGLDDALGPVRGRRAAAREISESTRPARKAAYDAAYSTPIDYSTPQGMEIEALFNRVNPKTARQAIDIANDWLRWEGGERQILAKIADDGSVSFMEKPSVRQLDVMKRAFDEIDQKGRDTFGRATDGGLAADQARAIREATKDATGGAEGPYARALAEGQGKISMDQGLQLGLDMLRKRDITREVFAEDFARLPKDAKEMVKAGLRTHVDDVLSRVNMVASDSNVEAREAMQALRLLSSRDAMSKLGVLLGDEARPLVDKLTRAQSAMEMRASVARNSATGIRQSIQGEGKDILEPGMIGKLARGQPVDATQRLTQGLLGTTPADDAMRAEAMWTDIANVLTERRGSERATKALEFIDKALSGQPLKDRESKLIANELLTALTLSGGRGGNQSLAVLTSQ